MHKRKRPRFAGAVSQSCTVRRASQPVIRKRVANILAGIIAARNRDDDVLLAIDHIGHRRARLRRRQQHIADFLAGRLIIGAQRCAARMIRRGGDLTVARDHQVLGHQGADIEARLAGAGHVDALERRIVADRIGRVAMRDLPDDVTLVHVDRADGRVRRLQQRQALDGEVAETATTTAGRRVSAAWARGPRRHPGRRRPH